MFMVKYHNLKYRKRAQSEHSMFNNCSTDPLGWLWTVGNINDYREEIQRLHLQMLHGSLSWRKPLAGKYHIT